MNKREAQRQAHQQNTLMALGFTQDEADALRRISMTLRRWHELECGDGNGYIARDEKTGKPYYVNCNSRYVSANDPRARHAIADREKGALARLKAIVRRRNDCQQYAVTDGKITWPRSVRFYIQTDPRGAALYIIRPGDVPEGWAVDSCYTRGICVY